VGAHTDAFIRSRVAAGPSVAVFRLADANGMFVLDEKRWIFSRRTRPWRASIESEAVTVGDGRAGGGGDDPALLVQDIAEEA
jgi:hypothetical protein